MGLRVVTDCKWAKEERKASLIELAGLEMGLIKFLNEMDDEMGYDDDNSKGRNYQLVDSYTVYRDGQVHVLDGVHDVIMCPCPEYDYIYINRVYICESGHRIVECFLSIEDAGELENEILISLD